MRKSNLVVNANEVPFSTSGKGELTKTLYVIPMTRQYILNVVDKLIDVRRMFRVNMKVYKEFM
jgi:hypothetical protein